MPKSGVASLLMLTTSSFAGPYTEKTSPVHPTSCANVPFLVLGVDGILQLLVSFVQARSKQCDDFHLLLDFPEVWPSDRCHCVWKQVAKRTIITSKLESKKKRRVLIGWKSVKYQY